MAEGTDKSLVAQERAPGRSYDLYEGSDVVEVYVDGASGAMIGPSVARMRFHTVTDASPLEGVAGELLEKREVKLRVIMPTPTFVEFLLNSLKGVTDNKENLSVAAENQKTALLDILSRVKPNA